MLFRYVRPAALRRSPTMSAGELAKAARAKGVDVDMFTVGDLFPKPEESEIQGWVQQLRDEAAKPANADNPLFALRPADKARAYSETGGIPSLKHAVAACFTEDTGIEADAHCVMVGNGGKGALAGALYYLGATDSPQILLGAPGWPTNYDLPPTGTELVEIDTKGRGLISPDQLREALNACPNPDIVFMNSPCNPTGASYGAEEREEVMRIVRTETNSVLVMDDPYGKLSYTQPHYDITTVLQRGAEEKALFAEGRMAVFRTASKEYGMADSRVGWVITRNQDMLTSLQSFNECMGGGMSARNQLEAQAALMYGHGAIERAQATLMKKRTMLVEGITALRYAQCEAPQATIYGWVDFAGLKGKHVPADATPDATAFTIETPDDMLRYLAEVAGICAVGGQAFYAPDSPAAAQEWHVRMSFCNDEAQLARGLEKLAKAEDCLR
jgi:aspartate aminotransferase